jgi:hypothetical protein
MLALFFNYFGKIMDGYQTVKLVSFLRSARCMLPPSQLSLWCLEDSRED